MSKAASVQGLHSTITRIPTLLQLDAAAAVNQLKALKIQALRVAGQ